MFETLQPLSPDQDQHTHFAPAQGWHFASALKLCPIGAREAETLAREYVIVFSQDAESMPIVLLSLGDTSAYVSPDGDWQAQQIPERCRLYPFTLVPTQTAGQMIVARVPQAPHFAADEGIALFDAQGQPAELVSQVSAALMTLHREFMEAQALTAQLREAGVIGERRVDIQLKDGSYRHYSGFLAAVEERIAALETDTREALEASGAWRLLACHRAALANFHRLL